MSDAPQMPEPETPISDAVLDAPRGNWVDRFAPARSRPFLRLSRADRPIGTWLLAIPCFWGLALAANISGYKPWDIWLVVSCAAGAFLMRGAGCTWNDITDRHIDAAVARTKSRPLPSGQVTVKGALIWMGLQTALAAWILSSYNSTAVALGVAALGLVVIYPFAKRFTWWPQVFLGLAFNWGALLAFAAHQGSVQWSTLALYGAGIAWTLFYDTIYAHQDKEDDALIGVKSTARLFGARTRQWLVGFQIACLSLMTLAIVLALTPKAGIAAMAVALVGVWAFGLHLLWQLRQLDIDDPASCLAVFRANRDAGLIPALFLAAAALV